MYMYILHIPNTHTTQYVCTHSLYTLHTYTKYVCTYSSSMSMYMYVVTHYTYVCTYIMHYIWHGDGMVMAWHATPPLYRQTPPTLQQTKPEKPISCLALTHIYPQIWSLPRTHSSGRFDRLSFRPNWFPFLTQSMQSLPRISLHKRPKGFLLSHP